MTQKTQRKTDIEGGKGASSGATLGRYFAKFARPTDPVSWQPSKKQGSKKKPKVK